MFASKRLQKELVKLQSQTPPGIELVDASNLKEWTMDIRVLDANPIYANSTYRLLFRFPEKYPIEPPNVHFILNASPQRAIPLHPHIYSNGVICLDLLGTSGWSPVHNVESVCISLQSMLTGNTKAERPPGDADFVRRTGFSGKTKGVGFVYDDDTV